MWTCSSGRRAQLTLGRWASLYCISTTRNIFIFTNGQAALKSLKSLRVSSKIVKECLDLLADLISYFTLNLQWVPGHSDIPGNCEANDLGRTSTTLQLDSEKERLYSGGHEYSTHLNMFSRYGFFYTGLKHPRKNTAASWHFHKCEFCYLLHFYTVIK